MRQGWAPMTLTYLGDVHKLLQGGMGKVSVLAADTGDTRKPKGQG
jgi:hypothetical protein